MPITYFSIVGPNDASIFEHGRYTGEASSSSSETMQLARQFMMFSALDLAEEAMWTRGDFYLSKIDKFDDRFFVSAYIAFAPVKLLLMQDQEPHDNVRPFFTDAFELCVKYLMSPFANASQPIRNREFEERMIAIFTKYF